ncbi:MAG: hypothetical protein RL208_661 [Pseudomonadota bacterium]|jgi:hypothetical protein
MADGGSILGVQAGGGPFDEAGGAIFNNFKDADLGANFAFNAPVFESGSLSQAIHFSGPLSECITDQFKSFMDRFVKAPDHQIMNLGAPNPAELQGRVLGEQYGVSSAIGAGKTRIDTSKGGVIYGSGGGGG